MQNTTFRTLTLLAAISLFGGAAFASSHGEALENAVTEADEAAEEAMTKAKEEAEAAVMKDKEMEKQGEEFNAEEVGGVQ